MRGVRVGAVYGHSTANSISAYRRGVTWDAIVVGLGVMGAATLAELAGRGRRVLGLERFALPHARGSSQGGTRIIREAYFEHPLYVPLVQRAYERWRVLERRSGVRLIVPTGGLTIGPPDGRLVTGALASAVGHGLAHTVLTATEVADRYPAVRLPDGVVAVHEPRAGVLLAARAVAALIDAARQDGAEVRDDAPIGGWDVVDGGVRVVVDGETVQADRLVLAAGSWMPALVPELAPDLRIERNVVHWFRPAATSAPGSDAAAFGPGRLPVLVIEDTPEHLLYALPSMRAEGDDLEDGVKFACHHSGVLAATADAVDRQPGADDVAAIRADVSRYLPGLEPEPVRSSVCTYTNTPDGHFLVDRHPRHDAVILVSPCSGHGFKFASVLGELVADLATDVNVHGKLAPFAARRYSSP
jgi:sarcosine oxidase